MRSFFSEPSVANPPARIARDWWFAGVILLLALVELAVNTPLFWRPWHIGIVILTTPTLFWRRTHPLRMLLLGFVPINIMLVIAAVIREVPEGPYTAAFLLVLIYAVFRWGSGRDAQFALVLMAAMFALNIVIDYGGIGETIGGLLVMAFPAELGVLMRYQRRSQQQALDEVRLQEREQIARELHDTVAHHVSAIVIQAQAGQAVADRDPAAARRALEVIEEASARTLSEMRSMVGSLRGDETAELVPQPGLSELSSLAGSTGGILVEVAPLPILNAAPAAVGAALFRIAQESVTNAIRHAPAASQVDIRVDHDGNTIRLRVKDNGQSIGPDVRRDGYGLVGMSERARLLGGTLEAGPAPGGGWLVDAVLPMATVGAS